MLQTVTCYRSPRGLAEHPRDVCGPRLLASWPQAPPGPTQKAERACAQWGRDNRHFGISTGHDKDTGCWVRPRTLSKPGEVGEGRLVLTKAGFLNNLAGLGLRGN